MGGNCTVPGALYVPEVSRDLRFSLVMPAPSDNDVGGGFHRGGCARLSRHALMRRRGYGSGLYKVLINEARAGLRVLVVLDPRSSIHDGVPAMKTDERRAISRTRTIGCG